MAYFVCPQIVALSFKSNNRPAFGVLTGMCVCACVYVCVSMMGLSCRHSYRGYKGKTILQHALCSKNCGINSTHMPALNLDICICETKFLSPFFYSKETDSALKISQLMDTTRDSYQNPESKLSHPWAFFLQVTTLLCTMRVMEISERTKDLHLKERILRYNISTVLTTANFSSITPLTHS